MSSAVEEKVRNFVTNGKAAHTHPAKLLVFSKMLDEVFGVKIEDIIPGIEKKLGSKLLGVRGSIDLVFSGFILELKIDLEKEWPDAKAELIKYFQCLKEERPSEKYVAIATDLVNYNAYHPKIESDVVVDLVKIGSINATTSEPAEFVIWLDSFMFSTNRKPPTAEDLKIRFGAGSPTYALVTQELREKWQTVMKDRKHC